MPYADSSAGSACQKKWRRANKPRVRELYRNWYSSNQSSVYFAQIKKLYGMSLDEYAELDEDQNWVCAICSSDDGKLCVDHNHDNGVVRGLLCHRCNLEVGKLEQDAALTQKRLAYIQVGKVV